MKRRQFMKLLAVGATVAAAAPVFAACSQPESTQGDASGTEEKKNALRVAAIGSPGDQLDPSAASSTATWAGIYALFESLVVTGATGPVMQLAASAEPNKDATEWTVKLRDGAKFSDGSPVTAEDVLASFKFTADSQMLGATIASIDIKKSSAKDDNTVVFTLQQPRADFVESVLAKSSLVFKGGDPAKGIGSGPYVLENGSAADGWSFKANEHFPAEKRISDTLEVRVIADADARIRAVNSGEVDLALDLPVVAAKTLGDSAEIWTYGPSDSKNLGLFLNTSVAPFDDVHARQAFKLAIDREKLSKAIFDGHGKPGDDVPGKGMESYPKNLAAKRDVEKAKKLFAEANVKELTLTTADVSPGMNDAAHLIAEQLKEAGVSVKVDERDASSYYSDIPGLMKLPLFATYLQNFPTEYGLQFTSGTNGTFNLSGWGKNAEWDAKLAKIGATVDDAERTKLVNELAETYAKDGGTVLWGVQDTLHGRVKGTPDVIMSQGAPVFVAQ
ncbi:ABC transporter substrate-binding protein [Corynebacterium freiburgense]|uniref:ABC transporter substrate-binding protein n=1 Tax=Corynebacterium freiburgense TaxID=556548 RepID=UPI00047CCAA1|nr:ABC transporter substrate-binding protein [Corynebacterium freiburgense]WJZ02240.1 putative D,D-dipeptide-binding periplasmic protein DdpA precursor [Corynebacterium freiburgense]